MKYLAFLAGVIIFGFCVWPEWFIPAVPVWLAGLALLYSHKQTEEYKILERRDGFGTTYIPVLVQHNTLLWWKWDKYGFVYPEHIGEFPDKHTYFDGAKFVIEEYKRFLEKSKVKIETNELPI